MFNSIVSRKSVKIYDVNWICCRHCAWGPQWWRNLACYSSLLPSPHRLASGEGIVVLGVSVCVCVSAEPRLRAHRISLGGEGNVLYPVLSSCQCCHWTVPSGIAYIVKQVPQRWDIPTGLCSPETHQGEKTFHTPLKTMCIPLPLIDYINWNFTLTYVTSWVTDLVA